MMQILPSYLSGQWVSGSGKPREVYHAINGSLVSLVNTDGLNFVAALQYAKERGHHLRNLDFHQRALIVKSIAKHLFDRKDIFYPLSYQTGATKSDSWIDIEGAINTLFAISSIIRKGLPANHFQIEEDLSFLSKGGGFIGKHILSPKQGVALHINSFNFPVWGMLEKLAGNWIAGVPAIVKPATSSAYLTQAVVSCIIDSGLLPEGALQLVSGSLGDMLEHLDFQDTVTFTGSADTGLKIRSHPNILAQSIAVNIEADSLNACILGEDIQAHDPEFSLLINEVVKELSTKSGQRCTCIRRIFVPTAQEGFLIHTLQQALSQKVVGDPAEQGVDVGALIDKQQVAEVDKNLQYLSDDAEVVFQGSRDFLAKTPSQGAFYPLTLLRSKSTSLDSSVHRIEVFGPVATVVGYDSIAQGLGLLKAGRGSLVSSFFSNDFDSLSQWVTGSACYNGRMMFVNRDSANDSTGHGTVMPHSIHGGPGRAGGGQELGGTRSIEHYMQRTALQGSPDILSAITKQWIHGSRVYESSTHLFRKYYEDLNPGDSLLTHRRTVTEADIISFGAISGDHFYVHFDEIAAKDSLFKARVAHGYFLISAAAGLFVDPAEGPVLANYGLEKLRFIEAVYIGDTIQARLTFIKKNLKPLQKNEPSHGVVYWDLSIFNQYGRCVANYEILTLVATKEKRHV